MNTSSDRMIQRWVRAEPRKSVIAPAHLLTCPAACRIIRMLYELSGQNGDLMACSGSSS